MFTRGTFCPKIPRVLTDATVNTSEERTVHVLRQHGSLLQAHLPLLPQVLAFMEEEDIAMPMRDTLEPGVKDDLVRIAGKGQVPCLVVDGVPMFESDDIIRFLGDLILEREED